MTAKSIAIKRRDARSGGCVGKAVELTSGDLRCCPELGTEEVARVPERGAQKSAGGEVGKRQAKRVRHCVAERWREQMRASRNVSNRRPERCPRGLERQGESDEILMDDQRQKTQVELALANASKGAALRRVGGGTESAMAERDTESLAQGQSILTFRLTCRIPEY